MLMDFSGSKPAFRIDRPEFKEIKNKKALVLFLSKLGGFVKITGSFISLCA
jgi:hypothetical protein